LRVLEVPRPRLTLQMGPQSLREVSQSSHDAVIHHAGNVIETNEHKGDFLRGHHQNG